MKLYLRLFAECRSLHEAHEIAGRLSGALSIYQLSMANVPVQYRKIPDLFEFKYKLSPATKVDFDKIVACSGAGWLHMAGQFETSSV